MEERPFPQQQNESSLLTLEAQFSLIWRGTSSYFKLRPEFLNKMKLVAFYFQLRRQLSWTVKMLLSETNEKKKSCCNSKQVENHRPGGRRLNALNL